MPVGIQPFGAGPFGDGLGEGAILYVVRKDPEPDQIEVDPDATISFSVRDTYFEVDSISIVIDAVEAFNLVDGFVNGFSGTAIPNAFYGRDFAITHPDFEFASQHTVEVSATDVPTIGLPNELDDSWTFTVRDVCYNTYRMAVPPSVREKDEPLVRLLKVWDGIYCFVNHRTLDKVEDQGLFDPDKIPEDILPVAFADVGLVYPDFDEVSIEKRRRILKNADAIHASRYTTDGLQFYISLLVDATVSVARLNRGFFILLNSEVFGLPTAAMMDTSNSDNDVCNYLVGSRSLDIEITITGDLSDQMKQFLRETIYREIPMADDPINPRPINIVFLP